MKIAGVLEIRRIPAFFVGKVSVFAEKCGRKKRGCDSL
jgi:hypothetical protein